MELIDHINIYFGTEHKDVSGFIKDIRNGDLSEDYSNDSEKLIQLLMFINAYGTSEKYK